MNRPRKARHHRGPALRLARFFGTSAEMWRASRRITICGWAQAGQRLRVIEHDVEPLAALQHGNGVRHRHMNSDDCLQGGNFGRADQLGII